jgi:osmoprotectant transport system permease protein
VESADVASPRRTAGRQGGDRVILVQGLLWIFAPEHWTTTALSVGIPDALGAHLALSGWSLLISAIIALPLGLFIGHTGKGRNAAIIVSNIARAVPTLGLLSILLLAIPHVAGIPDGYIADILVFALLAIPPILAGAYSGLEAVDPQTVDAARAIGMTEWQVLLRVEIPLGATLIIGGLRSATLQIIATVTIASLYLQTSLGTFIADGLAQHDYVKMAAGAILVAALALLIDGILAIVQKLVSPRGVSRGETKKKKRFTARGGRAVATIGTPTTEGN